MVRAGEWLARPGASRGPSKRLAEQRVRCKEGLAAPGYLAGLLEKQRGGAAAVKEEEGTALRV